MFTIVFEYILLSYPSPFSKTKIIVLYLQIAPYFVFLGYSCFVSNLYLNMIIR